MITDSATSPFLPHHDEAYRRWRDTKLATAPGSVDELMVTLVDPLHPSGAELAAIRQRLQQSNMAIYASAQPVEEGRQVPLQIGAALGLGCADRNYLADDEALSAITVRPEAGARGYIPYTTQALNWHTDGYYNQGEQTIRAFILHCSQDAAVGGSNRLLDPELLYILIREQDPALIEALMAPTAMTIPAHIGDDGRELRAEAAGPVFSIDEDGALLTRYTARRRNVIWHDDPITSHARALISELLATADQVLTARLAPGMGLICNNVLHDRAAFQDPPDAPPRLLFRARFSRRISREMG